MTAAKKNYRPRKPVIEGPPVRLSGPYLLNRIQSQCIECDDCGEQWHWTAKRYGHSNLLINVNGKMLSVRSVVYRITDGRPVRKGHVITTLCHNDRCMNPELAVTRPPSFILARTAQAGKIHTRSMRIKIAATQRAKNTKIRDMEHANAIRLDGRPITVIAAEVGVSHQTVSLIKNNRMWIDYAGMFTGLGAR